MNAGHRPLLAVIPARVGSRRIARKNLREFHGRPLLAWTIAAARSSGLFGRVLVSTESEEIAEIARRFGAEVPFLRPPPLADDHAPSSLATLDAVERLERGGSRCEAVAQMLPTCPLRMARDVAESYRQFSDSAAPAQISVTRYPGPNPWWAAKLGDNFRLEPLFPEALRSRSQDLAALYCPTGAIWWARAAVLRREKTFYASGVSGWEIPWPRGIDIDTEEDWRLAEKLAVAGEGERP